MLRSTIARCCLVVAGLLVAAITLGALFGVPVGIGYVESGSMSPTLEEGDGFIAIPADLAGSVQQGDVVVYDAQHIEGGDLVTHRVVDETSQGYVTRGDANPATDQDGSEPYVTDGQITAVALQVDGSVVRIPYLGTAVMTVQSGLGSAQFWLASTLGMPVLLGTSGLAYLLIAIGIAVVIFSIVSDRGVGNRTRARSQTRQDAFDARRIVLGVVVLLFAVTFATMLVMSGPTEIGVVSAEFDSDRPDVVPTGETQQQHWTVQYDGFLPVVTVLEPTSSGIDIEQRQLSLTRGESTTVQIDVTAPEETGYYLRSFGTYQYFAVLPTPLLLGLHALHPWLAMAAVSSVVASAIALPFALALGLGRIRTRSRKRAGSPRGFNW